MKHAQKSPTCTARLFIPASVELGVVVVCARRVVVVGDGVGGREGGVGSFPTLPPVSAATELC